jgi:8-oxo-dGTP pyrophosphatase MutT (NUDIX family)
MKAFPFIPQAACIPFRFKTDGSAEVLLIRWNDSDNWGIPKGMIEDSKTARQTALVEAFEEAGVQGDLLDKDFGEFTYKKDGLDLRVRVYAMQVRTVLDEYEEKGVRERCWFSIETAAETVSREPVKDMICALIERLPGVSPPNRSAVLLE